MAQLAIVHGMASSLANIRERDRVDASIENACVEALCPSYMNGHGTCSLNRSGPRIKRCSTVSRCSFIVLHAVMQTAVTASAPPGSVYCTYRD